MIDIFQSWRETKQRMLNGMNAVKCPPTLTQSICQWHKSIATRINKSRKDSYIATKRFPPRFPPGIQQDEMELSPIWLYKLKWV